MRTLWTYFIVTLSIVTLSSESLPAWEEMDTKGSTSIASAKYRKGVVAISFIGRPEKVYEHKGVSRLTWEAWKKAPSKGRYYRNEFQVARLEQERMKRSLALEKVRSRGR